MKNRSSLFLLTAALGGCSLANTFDELTPEREAGATGGVIVSYDSSAKKIWVLSATDGKVLHEQPSPRVSAIAFDGFRELWYFFEQGTDIRAPAQLRVREMEATTAEFRDVGTTVAVPTPVNPNIGVLNGRLAYLGAPDQAAPDGSTAGLAVIDTTNPAGVKVYGQFTRTLPPGVKVGLIARPDAASVGGAVSIAIQNNCGVADCDVALLGAVIAQAAVTLEAGGPKNVGKVSSVGGEIGLAFDPTGPYDILIFPPLDATEKLCANGPTTAGSIGKFLPGTHTPLGALSPVPSMGSLRVSGAAYDPCDDLAFATSLLDDQAVWAIPFDPGATPYKTCGNGGGRLVFEPYERQLLRVSLSGDRIEAYTIDTTTASAPTLRRNAAFSTPAVFKIGGELAVRYPQGNVCNL